MYHTAKGCNFYANNAAFFLSYPRRIRERPATERVSAPAHTPLASVLRATAQLELSQRTLQASSSNGSSSEEAGQSQVIEHPPTGASAVPGVSGVTKTVSTIAAAAPVSTAASAHYSSLHTLSGYMDVGDPTLFQQQADKAWLQAASEQLVEEKLKQPVKTV